MKRVIEFANVKIKWGEYGVEILVEMERCYPVRRSIDLKIVKGFTKVYFSGTISSENRALCIGDIAETLRDLKVEPESGLGQLCAIWERWHMNSMRHGTRRQLEIIKGSGCGGRYDDCCRVLKSKRLLKDHGHTYGTDWLAEPLPPEVETELRDLVTSLGGKFRSRNV
jgi:hypothetical protein